MVLEGYQQCETCESTYKEEQLEDGECPPCRKAPETKTVVSRDELEGENSTRYVEVTCECDTPRLETDHTWSDGMAKHYWFECRACGKRAAVGTSISGSISPEPWEVVDEGVKQ